MTTFAIYKYMLSQISEREAKRLCDEPGQVPLGQAQEALDSIFHGQRPLPITKEKRDKTIIPLENEITCKRERVTLLLVCNEKTLKYTEKKAQHELTSHPGCYVVIDNREGVAQMAIERSPSFQSNPDHVRDLLQAAINDRLAPFCLKIEINGKKREAPFWEIIHKQTVEHKDRIKWIKFDFGVPEETAGIDASDKMKAMISGLNHLGKMMGGEKGEYKCKASENGTLHIDQTVEDMAQVIHYCSTNAYDISVGFRYYGVYRFGREERAFSAMEDQVVEDFIQGRLGIDLEGNAAWGLLLWLDKARRTYEDYQDVAPAKKTRKRRSEKQIA